MASEHMARPLEDEAHSMTTGPRPIPTNVCTYKAIADEAYREMAEDAERNERQNPDGRGGTIKWFDPEQKSFKQAMVSVVFTCIWLEATLYLLIPLPDIGDSSRPEENGLSSTENRRAIGAGLRHTGSNKSTHMQEDMPRGIAITNTDYTIDDLRARNSKCKEPTVGRRLRAIIGVMEDSKSRAEIALRARVGRQTLRDWVIRYNAEGPDGLKDRQRCGRPSKLDEGQRAEVGRWLDEGPEPGSPSWTIGMLREKIREVFDVVLCLEAVSGPDSPARLPQDIAAPGASEGGSAGTGALP